jgi:replicative DNA helicase
MERSVAELIIAKQRNGPTDTVKVKFDAQYTRFEDLPEGAYSDEHP